MILLQAMVTWVIVPMILGLLLASVWVFFVTLNRKDEDE